MNPPHATIQGRNIDLSLTVGLRRRREGAQLQRAGQIQQGVTRVEEVGALGLGDEAGTVGALPRRTQLFP